jgi:hypothetical protein
MEEIRIHHREKQANENVSHGCSTRYVPCQQEQSENVMAHRHYHHPHGTRLALGNEPMFQIFRRIPKISIK